MNWRPYTMQTLARIPLSLVIFGLVFPAVPQCAVGPDLAVFTPGANIINYSVYTTDQLTDSAIYLPDHSKLASGGMFGSAGNVQLGADMSLRSPLITVGGNLTIGVNPDSISRLSVGKNLTVGSATKFVDTFQVAGDFVSGGTNIVLKKAAAIGGNLALTGSANGDSAELRLGGTYGSTSLAFGSAAIVKMAQASGGPAIAAVTYNAPYQAYMAAPLKVSSASIPGYDNSIWDSLVGKTKPNVDLSGASNTADAMVTWISSGTKTGYYWKCSTAGLPVGSCRGDTLLPGYYGNLDITGNARALLLTEGFYSFKSINMGGGTAIIAAQPTGGRTVVVSEGTIVTNADAPFIGPDKARMATGYGSGPNQFLGGTMMVVGKADVNFSASDTRIWATLSAPWGDVKLNSQLTLFGQIFAKRLYAQNNADFSQGAFIPFRGQVPPFLPKTFLVQEKADPACSDPSGRPCHDTLLPIVIAYTTAYDAKANWKLFEISPRSATIGTDFKADSGSVFIKMGDTMATIQIRIFDDSSYEGPETFVVRFSEITGAGCPSPTTGMADTSIHSCDSKGTIIDDDRAPLVRIFNDTALLEGNTGTHTVPFTVRLYDPIYPANPLAAKNAPELAVAFKWRTQDASATLSDNDYVVQSPKWDTIASKGLTKSVSVVVKGDLRYENDEFFWAKVDSARNGSVSGTAPDSGWILNDDAKPTVTVTAATVQEPAKYGDTAWATITLQMSAASDLPATVWYKTQDSTARGTTDFAAKSNDYLSIIGSVDFPPNSVTQTVRVAVFGDTLFEKTERFKLIIDSLRNATTTSPFGIVTITDADSAPTVSVLDATVREPSTGSKILRLPVHLSRPSGLPSSFVWSTSDSTALDGLDYLRVTSYTVRIPAFVRDTFLDVTILSDSIAGEGDEYLKVKLGNLVDLSAGDLNGVGTIQDAQDGFRLVIDSVATVAEADSVVHFVAHINWIPAFPIRLVYRTAKGTAKPGMRYADTSGSVTIPAGSRQVSIAVRLKTDSLWEPLEYFKLKLDSILGANVPVMTDSVASGWIREPKDLEFSFDSPDTTVREDSAGTVPVRLRLSQPASIPVVVRLPVLNSSTATWILDFGLKGLSGDTLTIPAGNRVWTFGVPVVPDTIEEADELAKLGIVPLTTGVPGKRDTWTLTILDDDHHLTVVIQSPPDKLHTKEPDWPIIWTVDGNPQPRTDTTFPKEGWNCVERSTTDRFGRVYADTNCIWLDTTPPKIEVFKITGPNPHDRKVDTTWWGDWAKTRFGNDTIWYWVRDSILDSEGKNWHVKVDTLFALTHFINPGVYPTQVSYCDSVGNCAVDTGWIELKLDLPKPVSGVYLDRDHDGRIDAMIVELSQAWNADFLPTFHAPLPPELRKDLGVDSIQPFVMLDGKADLTRFMVSIEPPFRFGVTSFEGLSGILWENWSADEVVSDTFPIRDSVPPVILKAEVIRVENYRDPDTLVITPSEPLKLTGNDLFEVGACPEGKATCADSELVWAKVPQESVKLQPDGTYKILVRPGVLVFPNDTGSVRPGYKIRFGKGVSDTLGNRVDSAKLHWATLVEGSPRPDLVRVSIDHAMATMTAEERDRDRQPGILIRATSGKVAGDSVSRQWWEPGRGYLGNDDPAVRAVCPDMSFCNGPTLYLNRPARMIVYIYDNAGTHVMSRTVDISQADIDAMKPDQIDRLAIDLEWNHRTTAGKAVSSGVYLWRIVSYVKLDGQNSPIVNTKLFRLGVKIPIKGGIF